MPSPQPRNLTPPLERPSRISLAFSSTSKSSEYEFLILDSLWPAMLADIVEERKGKINCKILQVQSGKSNTPHLFLYEAIAMICMAMSTFLGACFPSIRLAVYPTRPFNGDHSLGSIEFPRHVFHVAWPRSVPKAFKNIGKATITRV